MPNHPSDRSPPAPDASYARSWREGAEQPNRTAERVRHAARRVALAVLTRLPRRPEPGPSLRCIFAHHVFDDERQAFARLIAALVADGATFVPAERVVAVLDGRETPDGRWLHLSFDDGFANVVRNALPVLERHGVPATFFVPSSVVGVPADPAWRHGVGMASGRRPIEMATWAELRAAADGGLLEVGSHTRTHVRLSDVSGDAARLRDEVAGSKAEIEDHMRRPCRFFSAPFGQRPDANEGTVEAVRAAGYEALFWAYRGAVRAGTADRWHIPRGHFEPYWPVSHTLYFARGGVARRAAA